MTDGIKIAPSILSADFSRLGDEVRAIDRAGCDWVHVDVMDGHFVPNLTIGPAVIKAVRDCSEKPFDVHLMIEPVAPYIEEFAQAGADIITIHAEADNHLNRTLQLIRALGRKAGLSLNPGTPIQVIEPLLDSLDLVLIMSVNPGFGGQSFIASQIDKVRQAREMIGARQIELEVDGGINAENIKDVRTAGADVVVAGSAVFRDPDYAATIKALREAAA